MINLYIIDNKARRSSTYGIGTYIKEIVTTFEQSEIQICLIHLNSDTLIFLQEIENDIRHWYVPYPKIKCTDDVKYSKLYFQSTVYILSQYIKNKDNLIFHLNYPQGKPFADALKATFNCKIILTVHFFSWCFEISGNISRLKAIIETPEDNLSKFDGSVKESFFEEKDLLNSFDAVLCLSKQTAEIIKNIYKVKTQNVFIIYNGLEGEVKKNINKLSTLKKINIRPNMSIIIFAGRLDTSKGLSYFIQASKIVLYDFPHCHILIAGSGDYDTYLKECTDIWANIHFTGFLPKEKLYELYTIADIGVMPSFHEQCSYVAIEMMMHGLPIIGSTTTGLKEMIVDGETGLHIPVIEYEDRVDIDTNLLAEKMLYLLQNPQERKRMGRNARKRYETLYTAERMRQQMLALYKSLWDDNSEKNANAEI
jgi:glycosyltransferase